MNRTQKYRWIATTAAIVFHAAVVAWCASVSISNSPTAVVLRGDTMTLEAAWAAPAAVVNEVLPETMDDWENETVVVEPESVQVGHRRFQVESTSLNDRQIRAASSSARLEPAIVQPNRSSEATRPPSRVAPPHRRLSPEVRASPASVPQRVGDRVESSMPEFIYSPPASYPRGAVEQHWEGTVKLLVTIELDGRVSEVSVQRSSGYSLLDGAAVNAVRRWRTRPLETIGRARPLTVILPVQFRIPDRSP